MTPDNIEAINQYFDGDDEDSNLDSQCPYCGVTYDEIDYEYQICHHCKHNNNKSDNGTGN